MSVLMPIALIVGLCLMGRVEPVKDLGSTEA